MFEGYKKNRALGSKRAERLQQEQRPTFGIKLIIVTVNGFASLGALPP
jgi:hypothetical protein